MEGLVFCSLSTLCWDLANAFWAALFWFWAEWVCLVRRSRWVWQEGYWCLSKGPRGCRLENTEGCTKRSGYEGHAQLDHWGSSMPCQGIWTLTPVTRTWEITLINSCIPLGHCQVAHLPAWVVWFEGGGCVWKESVFFDGHLKRCSGVRMIRFKDSWLLYVSTLNCNTTLMWFFALN